MCVDIWAGRAERTMALELTSCVTGKFLSLGEVPETIRQLKKNSARTGLLKKSNGILQVKSLACNKWKLLFLNDTYIGFWR